jgi:hypothetical protein
VEATLSFPLSFMAGNPKRKGSSSTGQSAMSKRARWEDKLAMAPSECSPTAAGTSLISGVHSVQIQGGSFSVDGSSTTVHNISNYGPGKASTNILEILRALSLPNFRHIQLDTLSKATEGTCIWLTSGEMFLFWVANGRILWGIGIRRSYYCASAIETLTDSISWSWEDRLVVSGAD